MVLKIKINDRKFKTNRQLERLGYLTIRPQGRMDYESITAEWAIQTRSLIRPRGLIVLV